MLRLMRGRGLGRGTSFPYSEWYECLRLDVRIVRQVSLHCNVERKGYIEVITRDRIVEHGRTVDDTRSARFPESSVLR